MNRHVTHFFRRFPYAFHILIHLCVSGTLTLTVYTSHLYLDEVAYNTINIAMLWLWICYTLLYLYHGYRENN